MRKMLLWIANSASASHQVKTHRVLPSGTKHVHACVHVCVRVRARVLRSELTQPSQPFLPSRLSE